MLTVAIEGNIGSGKSGLLDAIATADDDDHIVVHVHPEPVAAWSNALEAYYADPRANALRLSVTVLQSFREAFDVAAAAAAAGATAPGATAAATVHVFERSPESSRRVFASMNLADGDMTPGEWSVLCRLHGDLGWKPDLVIFLDVPTHVCCARIEQRARRCETAMSVEYVRKLEFAYKKYIDSLTSRDVVVVDGTLSPDEVARKAIEIIRARTGVSVT